MPPDITIAAAVQDYFMRRRHGAFPVLDQQQRLAGMLSLSQVKQYDQEQWADLYVHQRLKVLGRH